RVDLHELWHAIARVDLELDHRHSVPAQRLQQAHRQLGGLGPNHTLTQRTGSAADRILTKAFVDEERPGYGVAVEQRRHTQRFAPGRNVFLDEGKGLLLVDVRPGGGQLTGIGDARDSAGPRSDTWLDDQRKARPAPESHHILPRLEKMSFGARNLC